MRILTVGKNDAGQRLDKFLAKTLYGMPPSLMYRLIRQKKIKVNRKRAEGGQMLAEGDTVEIKLTSAISDGDALIIAPVPVAFTGSDESGAYFGRQSAPSSTTAAKGWARSSADLGWFPQVEIY